MNRVLACLQNATVKFSGFGGSILTDITLEISSEPTFIIGEPGAGKTTLLQLIAGMQSPTSGCVKANSKILYLPPTFTPITNFTSEQYLRYLTWVWGGRMIARDEAIGWLEYLEIGNAGNTKSQHLHAEQRFRLAIATALAAKPDLILLDEPSTALDPMARGNLPDIYTKVIGRNIGLVVSSRDALDLPTDFRRVLVLDCGRLVFSGTPGDFRAHP